MGQDEVLKILKKESKWITSKEIDKKSNSNIKSINKSLKKLRERDEINWKRVFRSDGRLGYLYGKK